MLTTNSPQFQLCVLGEHHLLDRFDCGKEPQLNEWLQKSALAAQRQGGSTVHVLTDSEHRVHAYFTLSSLPLRQETFAKSNQRGARDGLINAQLLGKFAIDRALQGMGFGATLMEVVFKKYYEVINITTSQWLALDAKNPKLAHWYTQFGFLALPPGINEDGVTRMVIKTKAVRAYVENLAEDVQDESPQRAAAPTL